MRSPDFRSKIKDADQVIVNNKSKVTDAQVRRFMKICLDKYIRAKIEPGEYLRLFPTQPLHLQTFYRRVDRRSGRRPVYRRAWNPNDLEDFPLCGCRFHERDSWSSSNQRDHQCCKEY